MADVVIAAGIYSSKHGFYKCHNLSKLKEESIIKMNLMLLVFYTCCKRAVLTDSCIVVCCICGYDNRKVLEVPAKESLHCLKTLFTL